MRFQKSKPNRLHKRFCDIQIKGYWTVYSKNKPTVLIKDKDLDWYIKNHDYDYFSSHLRCRSLRRFRKLIKKFNIKKGTAVLRSRYVGYDIYY